jgi:intracellular sulfur oxidation DsrE/DsrF family protein
MAKYLLIESRDPFESNDVGRFCNLAKGLADAGNEVTVFLVQNGVLPARFGANGEALGALTASGITVLADDFSLRERAIPTDQLAAGVTAAPLDTVIDGLANGAKTIWH